MHAEGVLHTKQGAPSHHAVRSMHIKKGAIFAPFSTEFLVIDSDQRSSI